MGLDYRVRCCPDGLMTDRRRDVRVLDCTIRDGGICNDWQFDPQLVHDTAKALDDAGVEIMEVGYQNARALVESDASGPWRFCAEADLRATLPVLERTRIACMLDVGRCQVEALRPASDSVVDVLRVACYAHQVDEAAHIADAATALGYEVFCNVMAITAVSPDDVDAFLERLRHSAFSTVCVVDSFGALYPHHIRYLIRKYKNWLGEKQRVGVHLHNNQQTAFANAIAAIDEGADWVDASVFGMGRGAGNVPMELLLMYLDDAKRSVEPILALAERYTELRRQWRWGYEVPYAIAGWMNQHPRRAIDAIRQSQSSNDLWDALHPGENHPRHHQAVREAK